MSRYLIAASVISFAATQLASSLLSSTQHKVLLSTSIIMCVLFKAAIHYVVLLVFAQDS